MKLEVGKYYRTRDGEKVHLTGRIDRDGDYWVQLEGHGLGHRVYNSDGTHRGYTGSVCANSNLDLIAEWTDTPEIGTLEELNVKPGDVVLGTYSVTGETYTEVVKKIGTHGVHYESGGWDWLGRKSDFRIISRAPDTLFGMSADKFTDDELQELADKCATLLAYRIKPEPVVEEVVAYAQPDLGGGYEVNSSCDHWPYRITFTTTDGEPATGTFRNDNGDVIKMERWKSTASHHQGR